MHVFRRLAKSKAIGFSLALGLGAVLLSFQNCAPPLSSARISSVVNPRSPFYSKRVLIGDAIAPESRSAKAAKKSDFEAGGAVKKDTRLAVMVDNACAEDRCGADADSVVCPLFREKMMPSLRGRVQSYSWYLPAALSAAQVEDLLQRTSADNECVVGVSESRTYKSKAADPARAAQYYHQTLKADVALPLLKNDGLANVRVVVIDTGFAPHEDIGVAGNIGGGACPDGPTDPDVCNSHGNFVTGIIGATADNGKGGLGLAPNALITVLQVGDQMGQMTTEEITNSVRNAVDFYGAEIINLSLGGGGSADYNFEDAFIYAITRKALLVVAAGNDGVDISVEPSYPASFNFDGQINVGAASPVTVDEFQAPPYNATGALKRDPFSNYGENVVHVSAPGRGIYSTTLENGYSTMNGTSFSTPMVTAAAAVAKGYLRQRGFDVSPSILRALVLEGTRSEASLAETIRGSAVTPFQLNRFLDFSVLRKQLQDFATAWTENPIRITMNSSEVRTVNGSKVIHVTAEVIGGTAGSRVRLYTNSAFLNDSFTGQECTVEGARQFCEFDVTFTQMLVDPELYFILSTDKKPFITDLTVPAIDLNFGDRESAVMKGQIINVTRTGSAFVVEGWACMVGLPDALDIEVRFGSPTAAVAYTTKVRYAARGDYFAQCNAPTITMGWNFPLPTSALYTQRQNGQPLKMYFKARHPVLKTRELDLPVMSYQPGYQDSTPAATVDHAYFDPKAVDTAPDIKITQQSFENWIFSVKGTACHRDVPRPAIVTVNMAVTEPMALLPSVWDGIPLAISRMYNSVPYGKGTEARYTGTSWSEANPRYSIITDKGGRLGPSCGGFSEIYMACPFADGRGSPSATMLTFNQWGDNLSVPGGLETVVPSLEMNDGCAYPSGFEFSFDVRKYIQAMSFSTQMTYNAKFISSQQEALVAARQTDFLKLLGTEAPDRFDNWQFLRRAFHVTLSTVDTKSGSAGLDHKGVLQSSHGLYQERISLTANFDNFLAAIQVFQSPASGGADWLAFDQFATQWQSYLPAASFMRAHSPQTQLVESAAAALTTVYDTGNVTLPKRGSMLMFGLFYTYNAGAKFGVIDTDFKVEVSTDGGTVWKDLYVDVFYPWFNTVTRQGQGTIGGTLDLPENPGQLRLRIRANGNNGFKLSNIGWMVE